MKIYSFIDCVTTDVCEKLSTPTFSLEADKCLLMIYLYENLKELRNLCHFLVQGHFCLSNCTTNNKFVIMEDDSLDNAEQNPFLTDEKLKGAAKRGVSITVSLVMLGFTGWRDLEPCNFNSTRMISAMKLY